MNPPDSTSDAVPLPLEASSPSLPPNEGLQRLIDEIGPDAVREVLHLFHESASENIAKIHAALPALNLAAIRSAAHAIKGSALNIGATELAAFCLELEQSIQGNDSSRVHHLVRCIDQWLAELKRIGKDRM